MDYTDTVTSSSSEVDPTQSLARDSAVVVELDQALTRAFLFDLVEGAPRFIGVGVSRSTALPPTADAGVGLNNALRELESQTGRRLIDGDQLITPQRGGGDGVDSCYVTGMPMAPVRAAVISVGESPLHPLLIAAARRTTTLVADSRTDFPATDESISPAALRAWLRLAHPSAVVLVFQGGSTDDWEVVLDAVADVSRDVSIQQGIVVADEPNQQRAATALGSMLDLSGIDPAEYDALEIAAALETELRDEYLRRVDALPGLRPLANATFVDRMQACQAVTTFLHRRMGRNVLSVTGGEGTLLEAAIAGRGISALRADLDLSLGVRSLMHIPPELVTRWLPFRSSAEEINQWVLNRALRPFTELASPPDTWIAAAFEREILATLARDTGMIDQSEIDLIAFGSGLSHGQSALTALTLLDGIVPNPPNGVVSLAEDSEGMMTAVGALSSGDPAYASEIIEQDFLTPLATCIIITGSGTDGALAVRGELRRGDSEPRRFSVPLGSLHRLPLDVGEEATLTLTPEPGFSIGTREAGQSVTFGAEHQIFGGELGVIIDARGRPFALPTDPEVRVSRLKTWITDLGGRVD